MQYPTLLSVLSRDVLAPLDLLVAIHKSTPLRIDRICGMQDEDTYSHDQLDAPST
jgi:hypothetical protein